ncbi:hypothetical protein [Clostridium sp.]|jgi:hypothetical protein|uniref:hypothetical protein n=1 Tax=Clostridium sp. TaxID=1506 RepID=UPI003EED297F
MTKYMSLKGASGESGITEYSLRLLCKQKKIRFNLAGHTKYILRMDWLEEDLERLALENIKVPENIVPRGKVRRIEA